MELKTDDTAKSIVPVLACVLQQLCLRNDKLPINKSSISKFHALRPPPISIAEYLNRIAKYAACSGECFVLALVYIDRIIQTNPTFVVNSLNIHRLLITSVMLAAKYFDDHYFNNAYYAKVGGVPCGEINSLEVEFLFMTNFTLFVSTDTYTQYYTELCNHAHHSPCGCGVTPIPPLVIPYVTTPGPDSPKGEIDHLAPFPEELLSETGLPEPASPSASTAAGAAAAAAPAPAPVHPDAAGLVSGGDRKGAGSGVGVGAGVGTAASMDVSSSSTMAPTVPVAWPPAGVAQTQPSWTSSAGAGFGFAGQTLQQKQQPGGMLPVRREGGFG